MFVDRSVFILVLCLETTTDFLHLVLLRATLVSVCIVEGSWLFLVLKKSNEPIFFHLWGTSQGMGENICKLYKQAKPTGIIWWLVMGNNLSVRNNELSRNRLLFNAILGKKLEEGHRKKQDTESDELGKWSLQLTLSWSERSCHSRYQKKGVVAVARLRTCKIIFPIWIRDAIQGKSVKFKVPLGVKSV